MKWCFPFKVCELSEEQTHHLVKMIRDFSILFYRVRKNISYHVLDQWIPLLTLPGC